jgi:hypothetical protein
MNKKKYYIDGEEKTLKEIVNILNAKNKDNEEIKYSSFQQSLQRHNTRYIYGYKIELRNG